MSSGTPDQTDWKTGQLLEIAERLRSADPRISCGSPADTEILRQIALKNDDLDTATILGDMIKLKIRDTDELIHLYEEISNAATIRVVWKLLNINCRDKGDFIQIINSIGDIPTIVYFVKNGYDACARLEETLLKVIRSLPTAIRLVKVDIDEVPTIAAAFSVETVPAVYAFKNGTAIGEFFGEIPELNVFQFVRNYVSKFDEPSENSAHAIAPNANTAEVRAEEPSPEEDRALARERVEEFWRELIAFGRQVGRTNPNISREGYALLAAERSRKFTERNEALAEQMMPDRGDAFLAMIEEEDNVCFEQHQTDPNAFYRRLSLKLTAETKAPNRGDYQREGLGELAVRTAVRATVWQLVRSLFRW